MPLRYWPVLKEVGRPISLAEIPRAQLCDSGLITYRILGGQRCVTVWQGCTNFYVGDVVGYHFCSLLKA